MRSLVDVPCGGVITGFSCQLPVLPGGALEIRVVRLPEYFLIAWQSRDRFKTHAVCLKHHYITHRRALRCKGRRPALLVPRQFPRDPSALSLRRRLSRRANRIWVRLSTNCANYHAFSVPVFGGWPLFSMPSLRSGFLFLKSRSSPARGWAVVCKIVLFFVFFFPESRALRTAGTDRLGPPGAFLCDIGPLSPD